jgi:transcriptional regulator with XRE-family HTH domain
LRGLDAEVARIFGENLKRCRLLMDMSQAELATRASIDRTEVSQLERSIREPKLSTVVKIQASLEASYEELTKGLVWRPGSVHQGSFQSGQSEVGE